MNLQFGIKNILVTYIDIFLLIKIITVNTETLFPFQIHNGESQIPAWPSLLGTVQRNMSWLVAEGKNTRKIEK